MKNELTQEQVEQKYKMYNVIFIVMLCLIALTIIMTILLFVSAYYNGVEPSSLCGFLSGGCETVYGMSAVKELELSLIVLVVFGSPFILVYIIVLVIIFVKRNKYKLLKENKS